MTDEERAWVEHWADREDALGGFPGSTGGVGMNMATAVKGEVIAYDAVRATATVRVEDGEEVQMHAAGYFSGSLPAVGDKILGQMVTIQGVHRIVAARPQVKVPGLP